MSLLPYVVVVELPGGQEIQKYHGQRDGALRAAKAEWAKFDEDTRATTSCDVYMAEVMSYTTDADGVDTLDEIRILWDARDAEKLRRPDTITFQRRVSQQGSSLVIVATQELRDMEIERGDLVEVTIRRI